VPRWPRNGHELLYGTDDERIMAVACTIQGSSFKAGKPRMWACGRVGNTGVFPDFDVTPNGNRVAALLPAIGSQELEPNQVTFLLDFFDEVRCRVPRAAN
jgi:hypothetical protein